jgi:hypothetical protein
VTAGCAFGVPHGNDYKYDVFVLMPFAAELQPVFDEPLQAVAARLNLSIARADDFFTAGVIIERVWAAIVQSRVLLADCTGRNPNVFYEIGMAHSIGKPVILITQKPEDVPFDLSHHSYIQYDLTREGIRRFEVKLRITLTHRSPKFGGKSQIALSSGHE